MIVSVNVVRVSLLFTLLTAVCLSVTVAQASTVDVGGCTSNINFPSITAAIAAVPSGSTIKVCPGQYTEQFSITKKLTLEGVASGNDNAVVILPPPGGLVQNTTDARGLVAAQILVQNTAGLVLISNITVDGTGNNYTAGDVRGILFQDASGTVNHVATRNQIPGGTLNGGQSGQGIMVETTNSSSAALLVENSSVHNYNKNGIVGRYAGASLTATSNYVQGSGSVSGSAAQNGIEIAFGATGTVKTNTVIDNVYNDPSSATASDILLYDTQDNSGMQVSGNIVGNSQATIALVNDNGESSTGSGVTVSGNKIFGTSTEDAIDVCTNGNQVTGNTIFNTAQSGVHLDGGSSCGSASGSTGNNNTVSGNIILESACAGYLVDSSTSGNGTPSGTFYTVPFETASNTNSCTIPEQQVRTRTAHKFKP